MTDWASNTQFSKQDTFLFLLFPLVHNFNPLNQLIHTTHDTRLSKKHSFHWHVAT